MPEAVRWLGRVLKRGGLYSQPMLLRQEPGRAQGEIRPVKANYWQAHCFEASGTSDNHHSAKQSGDQQDVGLARTYGSREFACSARHVQILT